MHTVLPEGVDEPEVPRISIGINFEVAVPPLPRPWRPPGSEMRTVATAAADTVNAAASPAAARATFDRDKQLLATKHDGDSDAEPEPFLMLSAAEALARGFADGEEVVMPMPVFSDSEED